jgi:hypothetical protein
MSPGRAALQAYLEALSVPCVVVVTPIGGGAPQVFQLEAPARAREETPASEVEQDIMYVVGESPGPLTTLQILEQMERLDLIYSEDTVKKALARLTGSGRLVNPPRI